MGGVFLVDILFLSAKISVDVAGLGKSGFFIIEGQACGAGHQALRVSRFLTRLISPLMGGVTCPALNVGGF